MDNNLTAMCKISFFPNQIEVNLHLLHHAFSSDNNAVSYNQLIFEIILQRGLHHRNKIKTLTHCCRHTFFSFEYDPKTNQIRQSPDI